jgi:hypothetical protein
MGRQKAITMELKNSPPLLTPALFTDQVTVGKLAVRREQQPLRSGEPVRSIGLIALLMML